MNNKLKEKNLFIENIIKTYGNNIRGLIASFSIKKDSQDVEQEVYVKVWKKLPAYNDDGKLWGWLRKITVNTCKDHIKSRQYSQEMKTDYEEESLLKVKSGAVAHINTLINKERHKRIIKAINNLNPKLKEVIILYDIKEYSYEQISQKLKCPVGTVKSRLFNARKQLQNDLTDLI